MVSMVERFAAALLGFAVVAVTLTAGIGTALLAGTGALVAYGLVALRQRRRLDRFTERFMDGDDAGARRRPRERRPARSRTHRAA